MKRIVTIVISALLMFSIVGYLLTDVKQDFTPLTLEVFLNCLADFDVDFSGFVAFYENVKQTLTDLYNFFTFQEFNPFGIVVDLFVKPIQVIVMIVQNIISLLSETFTLITSLLQYV